MLKKIENASTAKKKVILSKIALKKKEAMIDLVTNAARWAILRGIAQDQNVDLAITVEALVILRLTALKLPPKQCGRAMYADSLDICPQIVQHHGRHQTLQTRNNVLEE